jgi:eukaryotic-like serine/threonine-protein kinase
VSTLPSRLGRYNVLGRLASGGMAEILLATMTGTVERPVVIKRILPHLAEDKSFVEMFMNEANIIADLRHPRVVALQELVNEGELFLVLEYVEGESVGGLMRRMWSRGELMPYWLAAHIVAEACSGLHAAHELTTPDGRLRHVVHRDVSPQNVMITYGGDVKVLDFGIAKARDRASQTEAGQVKGKFEYMSPEQCRGRELDRRSDIFSLGVLLYELSVGRRLFRRDTQMSTFLAICEQEVPSPRDTRPDYPSELEAICKRALARKPEDRYSSASEMRRDLVAAVRRLSGDEVEEDQLSGLLHRLFPDRIAEKRDMRRLVQAGTPPEKLPAAEVDVAIEIPSVIATTTDPIATRTRSSSKAPIAIAVAIVVAGAIAFALMSRKQVEPVAAAPPPPVVASSTGPPLPASAHITIETVPKGASVSIAGKDKGTTPLTVELPHGDAAIEVELVSKGYAKLIERVTPNADQKLLLHLERLKPSKAATPTTKTTAAPSTTIPRFD